MRIIDSIIDDCQEKDINALDQIFNDFEENISNIIIIGVNLSLQWFLPTHEKFKHKSISNIHQININSLSGYYLYKEYQIPIFNIFSQDNNKIILILNRYKFGSLIQYPPSLSANNEKSIIDNYLIEVEAFSENQNILEDILNNLPDWLLEEGDLSKQKDYLEKKVLIYISERLEFVKDESFEGYVIRINSDF
jgi:hypothetical protein